MSKVDLPPPPSFSPDVVDWTLRELNAKMSHMRAHEEVMATKDGLRLYGIQYMDKSIEYKIAIAFNLHSIKGENFLNYACWTIFGLSLLPNA